MPVAATASLDVCPTCKTVYEVIRHHVRPPADPVCETCQQTLPVADGNDWLTYRVIRSGFGHVSQDSESSQVAQQDEARQAAGVHSQVGGFRLGHRAHYAPTYRERGDKRENILASSRSQSPMMNWMPD
jgi:hypothetical protein